MVVVQTIRWSSSAISRPRSSNSGAFQYGIKAGARVWRGNDVFDFRGLLARVLICFEAHQRLGIKMSANCRVQRETQMDYQS